MSLKYPWLTQVFGALYETLQQGQLHHALLLNGQANIGKSNLATTFAQRLLCSSDGLYACGECKSCKLLASETHPDLTVLTTEEKSRVIKIDQVRAVIDKLSGSAQQGGNKVVIVDRVDQLNVNAANALLKSLEEPTPRTYFLLLCNNLDRLLPTVISRCHLYTIATPTMLQSREWLQGYTKDSDDIDTALYISRGSPIQALRFIDSESDTPLAAIFKTLIRCVQHESSISETAKVLLKADLAEEVVPVLHAGLRQAISRRLHAMPSVPALIDRLAEALLDKPWNIDNYFSLLEACESTRRLINSSANPRHDLLLEDLLIRVSLR